jgi:hypothetical protein
LRNWSFFIDVPELNGTSLSGSDKLKFVVFALGHSTVASILDLAIVDSFFSLQIVSANTSVCRARMDHMGLLHIRENTHDVFLLVVKLD